jgi:8-oxo-dGTP pyrophosphatase MutT (NUDIX family)
MSAGQWRFISGGSRSKPSQPPVRFFPPAQLRQKRGREQVAAVCYRLRNRSIEFLLVQTGGGRWTFPKGSAEPGLTHAQSAALEAFEEAGVHGRMEDAVFARYVQRKRGEARDSSALEVAVSAYLCEVSWLGPPQESGRNPSWFSPEKAKRRLREDRTASDGVEFARVVDRAVGRIRSSWAATLAADALRRVQFTMDRRPRKGNITRTPVACKKSR